MSITKQLPEDLTIRKAKYRVKNAEGKYELVYLETSADQVEETADRVFVTPAEKLKISTMTSDIESEATARQEADNLLSGRLDVIEGAGEGSVNKALTDAKAYTDEKVVEVTSAYQAADTQTLQSAKEYADGKVSEAKTALEGSITTLEGKVTTNEQEIGKLKDAISNKNNNTIVVNTEDEIATTNTDPKVGDLAFVITSKRAYIYKGLDALTAKAAPAGWVVFDEITNELDLVDYLKKTDADSTYRKVADQIAEGDLESGLSTKINGKADTSYVDEKLAEKTTESYVDSKVSEVSQSLTTKEEALKAEDTKITTRIDNLAPVVGSEEPVDTEAGHVWLEILGE